MFSSTLNKLNTYLDKFIWIILIANSMNHLYKQESRVNKLHILY